MEESVKDTDRCAAMQEEKRESGTHGATEQAGQRESGGHSTAEQAGQQENGAHGATEQAEQRESEAHGTTEQAGQRESGAHGTTEQAEQQEGGAHGTIMQAVRQESEAHGTAMREKQREHGSADGFLAEVLETFPGKRQDVRTYSPLTLAYIGDAVYDLIIRTVVVGRANRPANDLHRITVKYVSANAQSAIVQALMESLTEEERSVYRRGKNSKPHTTAKNASVADYLKATGFEAVIGYLYLTGRMDRALELVRRGLELAGMGI